jgi:hypothetical protein
MKNVKPDIAGGISVALTVMLLFGLFIGLPAVVWFLLIAAFVGLLVACAGKGAADTADRPWK